MTLAAPIVTTDVRVLADWVDENGHMNVAYYLKAFDESLNAFYAAWGSTWGQLIAAGYSTFAAQTNLGYRQELLAGERFSIRTLLLAHDRKRIHLGMSLHKDDGTLAATCEMLLLFIDMGTRRVAAMPDVYFDALAAIKAAHDCLERPPGLGQPIQVPSARP